MTWFCSFDNNTCKGVLNLFNDICMSLFQLAYLPIKLLSSPRRALWSWYSFDATNGSCEDVQFYFIVAFQKMSVLVIDTAVATEGWRYSSGFPGCMGKVITTLYKLSWLSLSCSGSSNNWQLNLLHGSRASTKRANLTILSTIFWRTTSLIFFCNCRSSCQANRVRALKETRSALTPTKENHCFHPVSSFTNGCCCLSVLLCLLWVILPWQMSCSIVSHELHSFSTVCYATLNWADYCD